MARRRRGRAESHAPEMDERWAVSYLDMMTVLFLTFVVLYSMSSIDAGKYEQLKNALATGFGKEQSELDDRQGGLSAMEGGPGAPDGEDAAVASSASEVEEPRTAEQKLETIKAGVEGNLATMDREPDVEFAHVNGTLVIRILSGETMFTPDNAELSDTAVELLEGITPVVMAEEGGVSVEGHADYIAPQNYETNWELSADRSVQVARHMIEEQGMPAGSVSATGFGSTRPMGGNPDQLDRNRRVDIVVTAVGDPGTEQEPATTTGAAAEAGGSET